MDLDEMKGLDAWLEEPYHKACEDAERFSDWAENYDYDLEDKEELHLAEHRYQIYLDDMVEQWKIDEYEAAMEQRWEDAKGRRMEYDANH